MKAWYQSKIVWLGILQTLVGALGVVAEFLRAGDYSPVALTLLASGILMVIMRIWFTSESIG
jgi:hypothetical protein